MSSTQVLPPTTEEEVFWKQGLVVAGIDEAGRGPLYGPVVCGAVILTPHNLPIAYDSKTLSPVRRAELAEEVRTAAVSWGVGEASAAEIDELGMSVALALAAQRALSALAVRPDAVIVDGPRDITRSGLPAICLVKGEQHSRSIAAASLLAKTHHDAVVLRLAQQHTGYGIERNMGYGTAEHLEALRRLGPTSEHRKSFRPVAALL